MESQEQIRLKYCNKCINKKVDDRFGTLCGLTGQKPNFKYTCKDYSKGKPKATFKASTKPKRQNQPYIKQSRKKVKSKSPLWIGGSIVLTVIIFVFKIGRTVSSLSSDNSSTSQYELDYLKQLEKAKERRNKVATINYLSPNNSKAEFSRKMETDTVIILNAKVKLKLPKRFRLTIYSEDNELPIKATSRGYYFICNKLKIDKNQDQLEQWKAFRRQLIDKYPGSTLVVKKLLTVNTITNDLDRIDFEIKNSSKTNVIGTARIVDYNNERYFFQLISDASNADHTITNKYLRYYVKVK
ncbi:hypothetical protein [Lacinutrix sp. Bg11-31]|uniref:hypothetical protein n=1 Tax=Lacinutrix sp. Bg11-31 TaxID=2057808 RepID=UPI000C310085|nr:hypothetical protein [Lacinutrix sp. Bg11-31]AUC82987.1 hypothetical protein CW733_12965 [Lacinutrix sp. Bg11-31]